MAGPMGLRDESRPWNWGPELYPVQAALWACRTGEGGARRGALLPTVRDPTQVACVVVASLGRPEPGSGAATVSPGTALQMPEAVLKQR